LTDVERTVNLKTKANTEDTEWIYADDGLLEDGGAGTEDTNFNEYQQPLQGPATEENNLMGA